MATVKFSTVAVGDWFKDSAEGCWHLKVDSCHGMYQRFGSRYQPTFAADEAVLVE